MGALGISLVYQALWPRVEHHTTRGPTMAGHLQSDGTRLLLVEDDRMLGVIVEELLEMRNYRVSRCVTVGAALAAIEYELPDLAVLDINVRGEVVFPVADMLAEAGVPFVFVTAAHADTLPAQHGSRPLIRKPFQLDELAAQLQALVGARDGLV